MKKVLSIVLSLCMLLSLCTALSSCILFECEFETEWSSDETSHWHNCKLKICKEVSDKAEHTWDDGSVTTKATQDADGVRTYTCTACGKTKTETIVFTGMNKTEWNAAFATSKFTNFSYEEAAAMSSSGVTVDMDIIFKFTRDRAYQKMNAIGETDEEYITDKDEVNEGRESVIELLKEMAKYDSYAYDAQTKTYKATKQVYVDTWEAWTKDMTLTFEEGKLVKIEYTCSYNQDGRTFAVDSTINLSYGSAIIILPEN